MSKYIPQRHPNLGYWATYKKWRVFLSSFSFILWSQQLLLFYSMLIPLPPTITLMLTAFRANFWTQVTLILILSFTIMINIYFFFSVGSTFFVYEIECQCVVKHKCNHHFQLLCCSNNDTFLEAGYQKCEPQLTIWELVWQAALGSTSNKLNQNLLFYKNPQVIRSTEALFQCHIYFIFEDRFFFIFPPDWFSPSL